MRIVLMIILVAVATNANPIPNRDNRGVNNSIEGGHPSVPLNEDLAKDSPVEGSVPGPNHGPDDNPELVADDSPVEEESEGEGEDGDDSGLNEEEDEDSSEEDEGSSEEDDEDEEVHQWSA